MVFLEVLELALFVLLAVILLTQVLFPLIRGTRFFPSFRRKPRELARQMVQAHEEVVMATEEAAIAKEKTVANGIRHRAPVDHPDKTGKETR